MKLQRLENENSVLNVFVAEIRDSTIQKDRLRFRKNMERIGSVLSYEISKNLSYMPQTVATPFSIKEMNVIEDAIVVCSILRAGLALYDGFINFFDTADCAFVSAYRLKEGKDELEVVVNYAASPSLEGKTLILIDPMIATGTTLENVLHVLKEYGQPKEIHVAAVVGSQKGVEKVRRVFPENSTLWIATIDEKLNKKKYIIPGIGDAGDLAFGNKLTLKKKQK